MTKAFDAARADFSGMARDRGLFIKEIHHKAVIEVAEEGTEAAAATAVMMLASRQLSFYVNRPFLFYIVESETGAVLFQGRIVDPR